MVKKVIYSILCLLVIYDISFSKCKTTKKYFFDHERGWFYKEVCEDEKKKNKKKDTQKLEYLKETTINIPFDKLDKLDPDEIRKMLIKARKIAFMYPTDHNIKQYQKLMNWIVNKSSIFMENWMRVSRTDVELAREASQVTTSSVGRQEYAVAEANYKNDILRKFKDKAGLVVIVKKGCPYCERQKIVLQWFAQETGWNYKLVDISQVPNIVRKYGVARVPDIFLVVRQDNGKSLWIRIGTGLHSKNELKDIIMFGLYNLKLIKPPNKSYVLW